MPTYPIIGNAELYDPKMVEQYVATLFRNVDWEAGQCLSILGIGEKGTEREGHFKERQIVAPAFMGGIHTHLKRWAQHHVAGFIVPAVLNHDADLKGDVKLDKVAALTAILLDLDSGDIEAKAKFVIDRLGPPTMMVASGGRTENDAQKLHLYWLLNEPSDEIERVAALRKLLAAKCGGDQSFGRATQVVRIPGSVHAKNGNATVCAMLEQTSAEYSLDDLADVIKTMEPMEGLAPTIPAVSESPTIGMMDFTPKVDTAVQALHRDVHAGGEDLTRFSELSKVVGFYISEVRAGRLSPEQAHTSANGWMLEHMKPAWPQARFDAEFRALVARDIENHGPFQPTIVAVHAQARTAESIEPTPATWPAGSTIPPRPWLLGSWAQRGIVTVVVAPGGVGKSSLMAAISLSLASGRPFLGKTVFGGSQKCWYWNLEDGGDNLARARIAASMHHGISEAACGGRLYVDSGPEGATLCTAVEDRTGFAIIEPVMDNITSAIRRLGIDVLIIDPFVSSHAVNENDNNKIDAVAKRWARVAMATNCSIFLVHHSTKLRGEKVTAESARGAGALNNAARISLVLNRMTPEQAEMWDIPAMHAPRYFSVADDKHNLSPAEAADWFHLVGVDLNNGNEVYAGDSVGVVTSWRPPQLMDGVDVDHLFQVQRALKLGGPYWHATQTKEKWAGDVIANVLKLDVSEPIAKRRVSGIMARWIESGALKIEMKRKEGDGRTTKSVIVGNWARDPDAPVIFTDDGD